ncbi:unnamed protein product [Hyaloperonospora brassicae]|uniref:RCC1-like domain-containing protein n=1 Tax=Hyaloperonospora brassicae TaxID=162125 RepID=A0AAV0UT53_HYABA|nr:unnamed protein product [Hyaloperonospora brassicae]
MECVCISAARSRHGVFDECISPVSQTFVAVDGGDTFTIGIASPRGDVVGWGRAFYGELPTGSVQRCKLVACGSNHVVVLTLSGQVMAWGWNRFGQVTMAVANDCVRVPVVVKFSPASIPSSPVRIVQVAAGGTHSLAIDTCGRVWTWGSNSYGQLGIGSKTGQLCAPTRIALSARVHHMAAGWAHSALVSIAGEVFTFGWGLYNQLGHGSIQDESVPVAVDALYGLDSEVVQVACGNWHTAALTASGDVYTWGWGKDGQLGPESSVATQVLPRVVNVLSSPGTSESIQDVTSIACGSRFTIALLQDGSVQWWGVRSARSGPHSVITRQESALHGEGYVPQDGRRICKVAAGNSHAILLLETRREHAQQE